jgi:hypothetical protein
MIEIFELEKGFGVKFPFELKDSFKATFRTAKWNGYKKQWEVGPRSKKKLEQWIEIASKAAEEIELADSEELKKEELAKIEADIAKIRAGIANRRKEINAVNVVEMLNSAKEELAKAQAEFEAATTEKSIKLAEAKEMLSRVCDINTIQAAISKMKDNHNKVGSKPRGIFDNAQHELIQEYKKIQAIGFRSWGLYDLINLNFNRPDRDRIDDCSSIYELEKIESEVNE